MGCNPLAIEFKLCESGVPTLSCILEKEDAPQSLPVLFFSAQKLAQEWRRFPSARRSAAGLRMHCLAQLPGLPGWQGPGGLRARSCCMESS